MARTESEHREWRDDRFFVHKVAASTKIYQGALVCLNTSGYAVPAADTAGFKFVGVAEKEADNSSGSNGNIRTEVFMKRQWLIGCTGADQTWEGKTAYIIDDNTVAISGTTNSIEVGEVTEFVSSSQVWVRSRR